MSRAAVVDPDVAAVIAGWSPVTFVPGEQAELVLSTARAWVTATAPSSTGDASRLLSAVVGLMVWVHSSVGDMSAATVLCPTNTELWVIEENKHRSRVWRSTARACLRRVGRAVNPDGWPAVPQPLSRPEPQIPYSASDECTFKLVAGLTGYKNRPARMWIAAGSLGAGMSGSELGAGCVDDVHEVDGRLAIRVRGRNTRIVPVRACWTDTLNQAVEATKAAQPGDDRFVALESRKAVYGIVAGIAAVNGTPLRLSRARATWLTAHLTACTPLAVLRVIAGPLSMSTLDGLVDAATETLTADTAYLRGFGP